MARAMAAAWPLLLVALLVLSWPPPGTGAQHGGDARVTADLGAAW
ncbi:PVR isoform 4 [Pongo abelii]|uniref:PVR isoform 4 n=1 Tax=Pongo abelii TaxID=9601 RepID=A0A2J8RTP3_PONAB|nr:PVR isoform 4 [Pongo abelii]